MGVEKWQVVYNKRVAGSQQDGTQRELCTKAQGEALSGKLTEKVLVNGPIYQASIVEVEAESAAMAAVAARLFLGADDGAGNPLVAKVANIVATATR